MVIEWKTSNNVLCWKCAKKYYSLSVHLQIEINNYDDSIPEIGFVVVWKWKTLSFAIYIVDVSYSKDK